MLKLTSGAIVLLDDEDYEKLKHISWSENKSKHSNTSYALARVNSVPTYMHRLILSPASDMVVDHINGNGLDNRRENLRVVSRQLNLFNRRTRGTQTSIYFGVFRQKDRPSYRCQIKHPVLGRIYGGSFPTEEEAARAYNELVWFYKLELPLNQL